MSFLRKIKLYGTKNPIKTGLLLLLVVWYYFSLPNKLFQQTYATVLESSDGQLLGAQIASDMQWRFPEMDSVPYKFQQSIVHYEDAHFFKHWGFNPVSMLHAYRQNQKAGKVIRGGSTLTQQVIRLYRQNKRRTYSEKLVEIILASRLEFRYSKAKILALYASHAPFGGNSVGLDAASWRYFGREPHELSWAESATLAVLPNAPGLIHVNKNRDILLKKRNALLTKLHQKNVIDSETYHLSVAEPLPDHTYNLPQIAPHLLSKITQKQKGQRVKTTVNFDLQLQVNDIVAQHYEQLKQNHVYNIAVLVVEVPTRKIVTYVGNAPTDKNHQKDVDVINKPRSTGSILKPFLFTAMLHAGELLPNTLVADVPTQIGNYRPENFTLQYQGAVPAGKALARSLNIPAVIMLRDYGMERFYHDVQALQLKNINKGTDHYGLSLILGGAESNLWDITRAYTNLASTINHYDETQGKYYTQEYTDLIFRADVSPDFGTTSTQPKLFDTGSIYSTFQTLLNVNRPEAYENWEFFNGARAIAWKTGTSFGFRDAWAVGVTPQYVVGVWVGNADGEGRPELTGLHTAAPLLFDVFSLLPSTKWFTQPYDEMVKTPTCRQSGYKASENCEEIDSVWIPLSGLKTKSCTYHTVVHFDRSETYQVNSSCESIDNLISKKWFVLPPIQAYYYQMYNPFYKVLPPFRPDCVFNSQSAMEFLVPFAHEQVFLPKDFNEKKTQLILKAKHALPDTKIFWYIDDRYIGETYHIHEIAIQPEKGVHSVTIVDVLGHEKRRTFKVL